MTIKYVAGPHAHKPTKGSPQSAGWDLYAAESVIIQPHTTQKISTGLRIALPEHTFGAIFARSGLAINRGLRLANDVAVIDSDYRGIWIVALHNDSDEKQLINYGDRIAQLIVLPYVDNIEDFQEVEALDETERGEGGLGSTGV